MSLLQPLDADQRATFLVVSLAPKVLRKLVGRLGTAAPGVRLETMSTWDLAWSLVDYYGNDTEVSGLVDKTLAKELDDSPLAHAVSAAGGAQAITDLVLRSKDPARDLAWAILQHGPDEAGPLGAELVQTIIAEFDEADARAKAEEEAAAQAAQQAEGAPAEPEVDPTEEELRAKEKEAKRAQHARERALKRLDESKHRVADLEASLAQARRELRQSEDARADLARERERLAEERTQLRQSLQSGTAGEVTRLSGELDAAARKLRALETELEETRESEATLSARVRTLTETRPAGGPAPAEADAPATPGATWNVPIFTDEFYDSIRRWDRKIVRNAFEKAYRLAEDWRHPSLRATALEGIPGYYRIRVATDVRLMYRVLDGNRIEIRSLIDREDLDRYIRQAKTR